jgi:hypothetical protein
MNLFEKIILYPYFAYAFLSLFPGLILAIKQKDKRFLVLTAVQELTAFTDYVGLLTLWIPSLLKAWKPGMSTYWNADAAVPGPKPILVWSWPINPVYGNREDGLLPTWYLPYLPDWLRVFLWTAWRNRSDNLKYVFAWKNGPFWYKNLILFGKPFYAMAGWHNGLVACSAGRGTV